MEFEFLQEFRMKQYLKLVDMNLDDEKKVQADKLRAFIVTLDTEVKRRELEAGEKVNKKENVKTESVANFMSHKIKGMSNTIATEVPIF